MGFLNDDDEIIVKNNQYNIPNIPYQAINTRQIPNYVGAPAKLECAYAPAVTHRIQVNPIEIFSCGDQPDDCTILSFSIAHQNVVSIADDNQSNILTPLVPTFYSELTSVCLDELRISNLTLKLGGKTYTQHEFCPPYGITRNGRPIKIPLVRKGDSSQCNSGLTLLVWGCYKSSKNNNLKTLSINGIIIDDLPKQPEEHVHDVDVWNQPNNIVCSSDNQGSSKTSQRDSHDW